ncbi:MAG: hypothetical protein HDR22_02725 [Lachnospiraceae bacterium]|nr:hypothetical protein [Lachnospiraceae bacterium]
MFERWKNNIKQETGNFCKKYSLTQHPTKGKRGKAIAANKKSELSDNWEKVWQLIFYFAKLPRKLPNFPIYLTYFKIK